MPWFHKHTALTQPIFALPVIGFLTGGQAATIFLVGIPVLFVAMQAAGVSVALGAFAAVVVFSMLRPPVAGYESRLFAILLFYCRPGRRGIGAKKAGQAGGGPGRGPGALRRGPGGAVGGEAADAGPTGADTAPLVVFVKRTPIELRLQLTTGHGSAAGGSKVMIMMDDVELKRAVADDRGEVAVVIDPDICVGNRTVRLVGGSGEVLAEQPVSFRRAGGG